MKLYVMTLIILSLYQYQVKATGPDDTVWTIEKQTTRSENLQLMDIKCTGIPNSGDAIFRLELNLIYPSGQVIILSSGLKTACPQFDSEESDVTVNHILYHETPVDYSGSPNREDSYFSCMAMITLPGDIRLSSNYWIPDTTENCQ